MVRRFCSCVCVCRCCPREDADNDEDDDDDDDDTDAERVRRIAGLAKADEGATKEEEVGIDAAK